jgi:hypothetical protein
MANVIDLSRRCGRLFDRRVAVANAMDFRVDTRWLFFDGRLALSEHDPFAPNHVGGAFEPRSRVDTAFSC